VTWEMRDGGFIDSTSCIDVNGIDHFVHGLSRLVTLLLSLILSCRSEKETSIWGEGQSAKEGFEGVIGVDVGILYS
jgi:hypothetical protein